LNREAPALLEKVAAKGMMLDVLHQAGTFPLTPIRDRYERVAMRVTVTDYIKDIASAYEWADFTIACGGSQTLAEIAVCGLPCLVVPLAQAAAGHQVANAMAFASGEDRLWSEEKNWDADSLARRIVKLLNSDQEIQRAHRPAVDAATTMITDCEEMMRGLWD